MEQAARDVYFDIVEQLKFQFIHSVSWLLLFSVKSTRCVLRRHLTTDLYLADFFKADETVHQILKIRKSFRWAVKMTDLADGKDAASPSSM